MIATRTSRWSACAEGSACDEATAPILSPLIRTALSSRPGRRHPVAQVNGRERRRRQVTEALITSATRRRPGGLVLDWILMVIVYPPLDTPRLEEQRRVDAETARATLELEEPGRRGRV
jgi:hypothetical protein